MNNSERSANSAGLETWSSGGLPLPAVHRGKESAPSASTIFSSRIWCLQTGGCRHEANIIREAFAEVELKLGYVLASVASGAGKELAANEKAVRMNVRPTEGASDCLMKLGQCGRRANEKPAPDMRADAKQRNTKTVDGK